MTTMASCPLCDAPEAELLWSNGQVRVIAVNEAGLPGYTRVIWADHVSEMTDLSPAERNGLMDIVWHVESAQRHVLQPDKINLAQFGNMVPHLHWHVIPRWASDPYFPQAIWAQPVARNTSQQVAWEDRCAQLHDRLVAYHSALTVALNSLG